MKGSVNPRTQSAFTIVELLVVIVVIAILAAITVVAYTGITQKAIASVLQSDLDNASRQLKLYYTDNGSYPTSLSSNCPVPADTRYCLKPSPGNTFTYTNLLGTSFKLIATKNTTSYYITSDTSPNNKNLLYLMAGDNASFEDGTVGSWWNDTSFTLANASGGSHGTKQLNLTLTSIDWARATMPVATVTSAGNQYTQSLKVKAGNTAAVGGEVRLAMYDNVSAWVAITSSPLVLTTGWQTISLTGTFTAGSTVRNIYVWGNYWPVSYTMPVGSIISVDAVQLESGSVATPF